MTEKTKIKKTGLRGHKKLALFIVFFILFSIMASVFLGPWRSGLSYYFSSPWVELKNSEIEVLEPFKTFFSKNAAKGVVLVVHGMNLKPTRMDDLARFFQEKDYDVFRMALTGHRGIPGELKTVTREIWLKDVKSVYEAAFERAVQKNIPLFYIGYSLGGLLGADLEAYEKDVKFAKTIYLAPALAIRVPVWLINFIYALLPEFEIASSIPAPYRANNRFTMKINYELCRSLDFVNAHLAQLVKNESHAHWTKLNKPTLVLMDPNDELVSIGGVQDFIRQNKLDKWKLMNVSVEGSTNPQKIHHAIMDEESVGPEEWLRITNLMEVFLH